MGPIVIEAARLNLREWTPADSGALVELFEHPEVNRFVNQGSPIGVEEALAFIARAQRLQAKRGWCRWAIELKDIPGEVAGFCGIGCTFAPEAELGWTLRRERWGLGIATEAASAALAFAFGIVGFPEMISAIDPANTRSMAVAERLGMRPDGGIGNNLGLIRYRIENPLPARERDPRFCRDCEGEQPGSSLRAEPPVEAPHA